MNLENLSLLIVEDDRLTQKQMALMLEGRFKKIYQAYHGEEGLELYQKYRPDLLISDINMPELDGLKMAQKIKEMDPQQPILFLSALEDKDSLIHAINIGVNGFVSKPIDMDQLEQTLQRLASVLIAQRSKEQQTRQKMEELYQRSYYDPLTQLPNRSYFNIRLEEATLKAQRARDSVTLFFIDLDDFKKINDSYGHKAGDRVLISVAQNVKKVIRGNDVLIRLGGDEFVLIIEGVYDERYLQEIAAKVLQAISLPIICEDKTIHVYGSIGISSYPHDAHNIPELLHFADLAMYEAKKRGKGKFAFFRADF